MREIPASEAKTHLSNLLDAVEKGETVAIKRHGRRIARLVPEEELRRAEVEKALRRIAEIRERSKPVTVEEILAWRDEGRK